MNEMTKREKLIDYIDSMGIEEKIALHNTYCDAANCMEDCIYSMWDLDGLLAGTKPIDILCMSFHGSFNPHHSFFWFNGYGNLESADYLSGAHVYAEDIADYILSEEDSLGNDEIQEILDEEDKYNE